MSSVLRLRLPISVEEKTKARILLGLVLSPFDVDVGLNRLENRPGPLVFAERHVVDARQLCEVVEAEVFRNVRSFVALHDDVIRAHRHHQDVAKATGESQVADVSGMDDVEAAVTLNDGLPRFAKARPRGS
jgi:hypothetical protein